MYRLAASVGLAFFFGLINARTLLVDIPLSAEYVVSLPACDLPQ